MLSLLSNNLRYSILVLIGRAFTSISSSASHIANSLNRGAADSDSERWELGRSWDELGLDFVFGRRAYVLTDAGGSLCGKTIWGCLACGFRISNFDLPRRFGFLYRDSAILLTRLLPYNLLR